MLRIKYQAECSETSTYPGGRSYSALLRRMIRRLLHAVDRCVPNTSRFNASMTCGPTCIPQSSEGPSVCGTLSLGCSGTRESIFSKTLQLPCLRRSELPKYTNAFNRHPVESWCWESKIGRETSHGASTLRPQARKEYLFRPNLEVKNKLDVWQLNTPLSEGS